jgi:hypothetical protein
MLNICEIFESLTRSFKVITTELLYMKKFKVYFKVYDPYFVLNIQAAYWNSRKKLRQNIV